MNKLIINRAEWNVGKTGCLLNYDETKCCLGFLALECGFTKHQIRRQRLPNEVEAVDSNGEWPENLFIEVRDENKSLWENIFAGINDDPSIDNETRELWIKEGFKTVLDYDVEFTGEYS